MLSVAPDGVGGTTGLWVGVDMAGEPGCGVRCATGGKETAVGAVETGATVGCDAADRAGCSPDTVRPARWMWLAGRIGDELTLGSATADGNVPATTGKLALVSADDDVAR